MKYGKLVALLLSLLPASSFSQGLPDFPFIIVSGSASAEVVPDTATVYFHLESYDASSELALATLETVQRAALDTMSEYEIPEENITADPVDKTPVRRRDENGDTPEILGYRFTQQFRIEFTSLERFPDFTTALMALDNLQYGGQSFGVSTSDEVMAQLIIDAGQDARENAERLAESLDVRIRNVHAINEAGTGFGSFQAKFGVSGGSDRTQYAAAGRATATLLVPKTIPLSRRIDVVYRIAP